MAAIQPRRVRSLTPCRHMLAWPFVWGTILPNPPLALYSTICRRASTITVREPLA